MTASLNSLIVALSISFSFKMDFEGEYNGK
jgi:hypothetical protein